MGPDPKSADHRPLTSQACRRRAPRTITALFPILLSRNPLLELQFMKKAKTAGATLAVLFGLGSASLMLAQQFASTDPATVQAGS